MEQPKKVNFEYLLPESYLVYIKNSVGSKMFQSYYVRKDNKVFDVLNKGELSCAVFVSTILRIFGLIEKLHFTTARTVDDLISSGAKKIAIAKIKPGDILVWESMKTKSGVHPHIGFYLGNKIAVSNSDKTKMVAKHSYKFDGKRKIEMVLRPSWKKSYAKS
jgi:hypothetical protein